MTVKKKSAVQLDREIAEALVESRRRPLTTADKTDVLRAQLSKTLWWAVKRRSGLAVWEAVRLTNRGYMFESSDPSKVRAFWIALTDVYYDLPGAVGQAAGKKLAELRSILQASWPDALRALPRDV